MDLIDRQKAIRLVHSVLYEMMVDAAATEIEKPMSKEDKLLLRVNKVVCTKLKELPSAEPELATNLQQTCNQLATDCISRQAVKNVIFDMHIDGEDGVKKALPNTYGADLREIIEQIDALLSAEPTQTNDSNALNTLDCISRQAAIDALEKVADFFPWRVPGKSDTYDRYNEGWNDAIGRAEMEIETLPSAEPTEASCWGCNCPKMERMLPSADPDPSDVARDIATIIENEKDMRVIAQPVRKGKWIEEKEDWRNQIMWVSCSECGFASGTSYNFCPNCGARMSEGEEDERI